MTQAYIETTCPRCGSKLVVCFTATTQEHKIIDPQTLDVATKAEFIHSTAMDVAAYVREGHTYRDWVHRLMEGGIPHELACEIMDEVKERKRMLRRQDDTLLYA